MHSLSGLPGAYAYVYMYSLCIYIRKRQHFQVARKSRASGNGPAALVFTGPVFLKVKIKINTFLLINKSATVILDLLGLIYISRSVRLSAAYTLCYKVFCCAKS